MALGKRLIIEASDIAGNNAETHIWLEGYTGAAVTRNSAGNPFEIKWGSATGDTLPLVYGSEATFNFIAETDYEFLDLFTSSSRDIYIQVIINGTDVIWEGFPDEDKWSEPLISPSYEVSLTAFDGLGLLKDEDFLQADKTEYTGEKTPLEILQIILAKTGLSLPLNTAFKFRPSDANTTTEALEQVKKDVSVYAEMKCYQVLENLFRGHRIMQRGGEWWVIANNLWGSSSVECFHYLANGTASGTATFNTIITDWTIEGQAELTYKPALKQLSVKQDYGYKPNLVENGDFSQIDSGSLEAWTAVGTTPQVRELDTEGNKFIYLPGGERLDGPSGSWYDANRTKYIKSDGVRVVQSDANLSVNLDYALMGQSGYSTYVFVGIFLEGDDGTDYTLVADVWLIIDGSEERREVRYRWEESTFKKPIPVSASVDYNKDIFGNKTYYIAPERTNSHPYYEVPDNFASSKIAVANGIPTTGTLSIYLFLAHSDNPVIAGSCFKNVSLKLTDENDDQFPTKTELQLINNAKNNYSPDDLELVNGDLPDIPNRLTVYDGGFIKNYGLSAGDATTMWVLQGNATPYTYAELVLRMLAAEARTARQSYDIRLMNVSPSMSMVIQDEDNSDRKFVETGITYDFRMQAVEGIYTEIKAWNIDDFTVGEKISYTKQTGSSGGSSSPAAIDTDERVRLMDENYSKIGQRGYLLDEDYSSLLDETTGMALLRFFLHIEADKVTPTSHTVTVTFRKAFNAVPAGLPYLKVYRVGQYITGKFGPKEVQWYMAAADKLTATGFEIEIETSESLTGVIVEYLFYERR